MKKTALVFLLFISIKTFSQCTISDLFPFEIGQSKFDITKIINSSSKISKVGNPNDTYSYEKYNNGWEKYDYLKNDSIYSSYIKLIHLQDKCFNGNENRINLTLADDWLYKISVSQEYSQDRYEEMMSDYNNYIEMFLQEYQYTNTFTTSNSKTNEKIGEGVSFFKIPREKRNKIKIEDVSISYIINYKSIYDSPSKKFVTTSEVDYYVIKIESVNLKNTKLTNQGF